MIAKDRKMRVETLYKLLNEKILVLDGATGTALQSFSLTAGDFGGKNFEGCNEYLNITSPHLIKKVHELYLEVGADIIETNSFGSMDFVLGEYGLSDKSYEISRISAELAREVADKFTKESPSKVRFVAGSMGPTTKSLTITGGISFNALVDSYFIQARGLYDGGVDYFLVETCNDTRNIKAAIIAIEKLLDMVEVKIPIAVSVTIEASGTMLAGQSVEALITSLEHKNLLYVGINCATGPEFMTDHIRTLSKMASTNIACVPNAGLPDENGRYLESPQMVANILESFIDQGWINIVGGCCGTNAEHIRALVKMVDNKAPRKIVKKNIATLSGVDFLELANENRPILVGERTNVIGSKLFKDLITAKKFDEAAEIAKVQIKNGADIIDVCLANPDSNELEDIKNFLEQLIKKVRTPLMIDSTDSKVIEDALTYCQGKSIINSINLENGEKKFKEVAMLAKKFGASLVIGTIDDDPENGMATTRERKLQIATRSYELLKELNIPDENMFFDPLVFPCGTGDVKYRASAVETIEGLRLIKEKYPRCKSAIGLSNVSFGLPPAGREVLNSVFLYHCVKAGLDLAIVNSQKLKRFASLSEEEIKICEDLLWNRGEDPITQFVTYYRGKKSDNVVDKSTLSPAETITNLIIEGLKGDLEKNLEILLEDNDALAIINGPLMDGMKTVGKLFNENKLIVAEVLQSAEVMKSAVDYLAPHIAKHQTSSRGKLLLATVKGDVHDIGKNLVDIIFSNNGFEVINLGIKIASEQLIQAYHKHNPDIIGLSGLLVKSANEMINTAQDLSAANISVPVLCGGAALSRNFVLNKIAPVYRDRAVFYAKDAMSGLDLANKIVDKSEYENLLATQNNSLKSSNSEIKIGENKPSFPNKRSKEVEILKDLPVAPDYQRHVLKNVSSEQLWNFINPKMLLTRHLGIGGKFAIPLFNNNFAEVRSLSGEGEGEKAILIFKELLSVMDKYKESLLTTGGIYQFFRCRSIDNTISLYHPSEDKVIANLLFPRQQKENGLSLADYISAQDKLTENSYDSMAIFFVTVGVNIREEVERLKKQGEFLRSHILAALTLELAEAYAEYLHSKIRSFWGHPDSINMTMQDRFNAKYHGKRYSYGYPACPNLEDQKAIFDLLRPAQDIGLNLTDAFMMDPEASVSALVFHHKDTKYFSV